MALQVSSRVYPLYRTLEGLEMNEFEGTYLERIRR